MSNFKKGIKNFLVVFTAFSFVVGGFFVANTANAATTINISNLQPSWTAPNGEGVYSAYYGPSSYNPVSPGITTLYDGREAGIIKAGFNTTPADDEGLFAFIPDVTIDVLAAGTLTYDVQNETGVNPVWMTIEIDTGVVGTRSDNTVYQHVPTTNPAGWNTFNAGTGQWQKWNDNNGDTTGNLLISLSDVAAAHTGLNVVRAYLRLGMGETYYNGGTGTTAWVDQATLGGMTYDFVVASHTWSVDSSLLDDSQCTALAFQCKTIQAAINTAVVGDTINVAAGTYNESVLINKSLTLIGIGDTRSVITGLAPTNYIVKIDTITGVTLDNLEINGGGMTRSDNAFDYGIWVNNSGTNSVPVELKNLVVKNIWNTSANGIEVDANLEGGSYVLIHDNSISAFDKRGVRFIKSSGKFYTNEVIGQGVDGINRVQNLINLWGGSNVEIYGNILHNAITTGLMPTWDSVGILVTSYNNDISSQANIHDNEIYNGDSGIIIGSVYATTDTSSADIINNNFHDLNLAINFEKDTASISTLAGNKFSVVNKALSAEVSAGPLITPPTVNATNNWWGTLDPVAIADLVYGEVNVVPYCSTAECTSMFVTIPEGDSPLGGFDIGLPEGATFDSTPSITILEEVVLTVPDNGGTSSVTLPADVVITKADGGNIDASLLETASVALGSLEGLGGEVVVDGAFQWGIPNLGLAFSEPITLNIFVGTALNGQTLNIVRSTSGSSEWTSDGIVPPATCIVSAGNCTFTSTKASFFAVTHPAPAPTPTPSSSGGRPPMLPPVVTPVLGQVLGASIGPVSGCDNRTNGFSVTTGQSCIGNTGTSSVSGQVLGAEKFNFTRFMRNGTRGNEVTEFQTFLNNAGYNCGTVDGKFGPKTRAAVVKFQLANGLVGDGVVGPLTRAVLNK